MPKRILLADDSITIQKVVELTFSDGDYEVIAVNNGAKAIQKLGEMRPDIILSDIIMPEKNGYEVCEHVKSHPEYRTIPVVLLTGTFEPFDPDRAEKAGCDAVVTKPFESQSLIHKVEELITNAQRSTTQQSSAVSAPSESFAPAAEVPSPSPWMDETPAPPAEEPARSPFTTSGGSQPAPQEAFTHEPDIFGAPPPAAPVADMQFDTPAEDPFAPGFSGETRAFPRMSFDDFQQPPSAPPPPSPAPVADAPAPWEDQPGFGGETRAFEKLSFDELQAMAPQAAPSSPEPEPQPEPEPLSDSPFGAPPPAEDFSAETRAFQRMSFDELQQMAAEPQASAPPPPPPAPEPEEPIAPASASPWDEPADSPFGGGETRAFPQMSFEELQQQMSTPAPEPEAEPQAEALPWDDQPAFASEPEPEPSAAASEPAPWEEPETPAWMAPEEPSIEEPVEASQSAMPEDLPFASQTPAEPELDELPPSVAFTPSAPVAAAQAFAEPDEPVVPSPALAPETPSIPIRGADLSEEQIDRIARRVVELMSEQVVRNIAWEVIPDLAEMVVKERIRKLESEA